MGLGRLANLEKTHILSLLSHINFHLVLIYWRRRFLFLRISNTEEKEQKLFCLYLWLWVSLSLTIQICIGFEEGEMTPPCSFVKGGNPSWVPAVGESWGDTKKLLCILSKNTWVQSNPGKLLPGDPKCNPQMAKIFFKENCSNPCSRWSNIFFFLSFQMH